MIPARFFLILLLLAGCRSAPEKPLPRTTQAFCGREERVGSSLIRREVYRAKVPTGWVRIDPEGSILDTRKPNVSFQIEDALTVTVHSFPTSALEERIPPTAQISRWRGQIEDSTVKVEPVSHGGFVGLYLEGGSVLAWAMQLDLEHYQTLSFLAASPEEEEYYKQMSADYTIKAWGPKELIERHKEEILLFARSFELIQEIPKRS